MEVKFTGHELDTDTNLTYANARYYNQEIGRWLSQDPATTFAPEVFLLNPQEQNTYSYVANNPLTYVDPTGNSRNPFSGLGDLARKSSDVAKKISAEIRGYVNALKDMLSYTPADDVMVALTGESFTGEEVSPGWRALAVVGSLSVGVDDVARYIRDTGKLPDNFINKQQARNLGWDARQGNLSDVAPGKSIGGDIYHNRPDRQTGERLLPHAEGRVWKEADINYESGYRGKERIFYSNDGLQYGTKNHGKTVERIDN